ncbi:MAG: hypothetical protein ABI570_08850 [Ilumatobacteraceae bacterium]
MGQILAVLVFLASIGFQSASVPAPNTASSGKEVLLVGDSVMARMASNSAGLKLLGRKHPYIFNAVGCQRLMSFGCTKSSKASSLKLLKANRGMYSKVVVVASGYNDSNDSSFARAVEAICNEAIRQGVVVLWLTYREEGVVKSKSISYNLQLRYFARSIANLRLLDWNKISTGHDSWFATDEIHIGNTGALEMATAIAFAIDDL